MNNKKKLREWHYKGYRYRFDPETSRLQINEYDQWRDTYNFNAGQFDVDFLEMVIDLKKNPYEPQELRTVYIGDIKYRYNPDTKEYEFPGSYSGWCPSNTYTVNGVRESAEKMKKLMELVDNPYTD